MPLSSLQEHLPWSMDLCPSEDCNLYFEHLECSRGSGFGRKGITNPWRTVLLGLVTTNSTVKELTMERRDRELSTNSAAFRLPPLELNDAKRCFEVLTKLRLGLTTNTEKYVIKGQLYFVHRNVAKLLRAARNLTCLSIDACGQVNVGDRCSLQDILSRCEFPNLTSLILACLESTEADIMRILRRSRKLQHLTIHMHTLASGSWTRLADWAETSLPLGSVSFIQLYDGFEDSWADTEYMDFYGDVEQLFFGKGENPFTAKQIQRYDADCNSEREWVNEGGDSHLERMRMFH